jgi:hypothetical protein
MSLMSEELWSDCGTYGDLRFIWIHLLCPRVIYQVPYLLKALELWSQSSLGLGPLDCSLLEDTLAACRYSEVHELLTAWWRVLLVLGAEMDNISDENVQQKLVMHEGYSIEAHINKISSLKTIDLLDQSTFVTYPHPYRTHSVKSHISWSKDPDTDSGLIDDQKSIIGSKGRGRGRRQRKAKEAEETKTSTKQTNETETLSKRQRFIRDQVHEISQEILQTTTLVKPSQRTDYAAGRTIQTRGKKLDTNFLREVTDVDIPDEGESARADSEKMTSKETAVPTETDDDDAHQNRSPLKCAQKDQEATYFRDNDCDDAWDPVAYHSAALNEVDEGTYVSYASCLAYC